MWVRNVKVLKLLLSQPFEMNIHLGTTRVAKSVVDHFDSIKYIKR